MRLGVEHELRLWIGRSQVDFRLLIEDLVGGIAALDPGDPRARRLPSGVAITADGREAELATPPLDLELGLEAGAAAVADSLLRQERTELRDRAAAYGVDDVTGFSTHLNVSVPDSDVVPVGRRFAEGCLPSLAVLTEPPGSSGVFVRPRRGRLELGCEYVEGTRLVAALELYCACVHALARGCVPPVAKAPRLVPSREKFGWFLTPEQVADDESVERLWDWARPWAVELGLDAARLDSVLTLVRRPDDARECSFGGVVRSTGQQLSTGARIRPGGITAQTEWLTWHHVVWLFRHRSGRACRAVVPAESEQAFLASLDAGDLDLELDRMLRRSVARRRLLVSAQLGSATELFHDVRPGALVPAERLPDGTVPRVSRRAARRQLGGARRPAS